MTTAEHRALGRLRQDALHARKPQELGRDLGALGANVVLDIAEVFAAGDLSPWFRSVG